MGKNRHDRHGGEIKGDTPDLTCDEQSFEILIMRHEHFLSCNIASQAEIWDPCIPLLNMCIKRSHTFAIIADYKGR